MSGNDETNPETYRPADEPDPAADGNGDVSRFAAGQEASTAAASGGEPPSRAADAEHTQQLPADRPTSVYGPSAQGSSSSYEDRQPGPYQPRQQSPAYSQGQQAHLGSPYTSVPATPAGYDFTRSEDRSGGAPAGDPYSGSGAYAPAGDAGESFFPTADASGGDTGRSRRRGPGWGALVASIVVASLLGAGGAVGAVRYLDARGGAEASRSSAAPTAIATGDTTKTVDSTGQAPDWEAVSAAVSNAVVSIAIAAEGGNSLGSGVIYDDKGHIITNNHVVAGASQIQVTLADGRVYDADITGTDPATDLAVIQLKNAPANLTVAQLGDSDQLTTGQDVMAIGNPLGLSSTVTTGIVSALDRPVVNSQAQGGEGGLGGGSSSPVFTNAIQIDAAVNPGNSGGPLFDEKGRVIGITSSIATTGGSSSGESGSSGSIGIGFAIPVKLADKVAKQLIESGAATHAYLGVALETGSAESDGDRRAGAKVTSVESGSPADKAGLKKGDVITAIDGRTTAQGSALTGYVRQSSANDKVKLTVIRDSKKQDIDVTLAERKDS